MPRRTHLIGLAATLALLAGCAAGAPEARDSRPSDTPVGPPIATVPPCEDLPDDSTSPDADALPSLTLSCLGPGPAVSLDQLTGRPTLVNLWATWCGPCREEMPLLQDAYVQYGEQVRFLGVDTQDDPEAAGSFLADLDIGYPHVVDPSGQLLRELGVRGLPVTLVLDQTGRVKARSIGQLTADELQQLLGSVLP
ncbi:TlpA disulfide reductase family protein [Modestobacter sp. DSM 44400]|uniref:TlpA family protein disulfide reductase n=1 Tax=Modestobacter sp. DSM 44400 TaxID=1550230 RepID=UPI0020C8E8EE|nr:TlpA disulfide reductase family protein [Modestobacter sp. DSM 44400]